MPVSDEDLFDTVPELGEKLRDGEFTSRELTEAYLDRLAEIGPKLNAVVTTTEERALEYADRADAELANGVDRGPLHGIPYGLKDLVAVDGYETTWGAAPYRDQEFDYNAEIVERFGDMRRFGSAQLTLSMVAEGALDATITNVDCNPWDTVAGVHMVRAAGGTVTDIHGERWHADSEGMVATNGTAHDAVLAAVDAAVE